MTLIPTIANPRPAASGALSSGDGRRWSVGSCLSSTIRRATKRRPAVVVNVSSDGYRLVQHVLDERCRSRIRRGNTSVMSLPLPSSPIRESAPLDGDSLPSEEPIGIEELFRRHAPAIASVGLGILQNRQEADDLVQDVFLRAWRALPRLQRREEARPWLMTIAIRLAKTRLRRRRLQRLLFRGADAEVEQVAAPGTLPEHRDLVARLYGMLNAMPADMHLAWALRYVHGETVESVANACGCSPSTAKRRIQKAHARITSTLGEDTGRALPANEATEP